jgi:epoxyqueuosine reductase
MTELEKNELSVAIIQKALNCGADLAGIASVAELKKSPSGMFAPKLPQGESVANRESEIGLMPGEVAWPEGGKSVLVVALEHPEDKPELDWWENRKATPGNRILVNIVDQVYEYLDANHKVKSFPIVYHIEKGGIYLKDAAVEAGLGTIGLNNMLITPNFGPRVRLRALILTEDLPSTGPLSFNPCKDCDLSCRQACPVAALGSIKYPAAEWGQTALPACDGSYDRDTCNIQMEVDLEHAQEVVVAGQEEPNIYVKYCRLCETACPIGKEESNGIQE